MSHYGHESIPDAKFESSSSSRFLRYMSQISLGNRERVIEFDYLSSENGLSLKKFSFYV